MRNNKALKEQLQQYLTTLLNDKATYIYFIDRDQKFLAQMHNDLGPQQYIHYVESIKKNQHDLAYTIKQISITKQKIEFYEQKGN